MNRKFSEFVTFDIAKKLKDAGFDLDTDYWYNERGRRLPYSNMLVKQMYNDALKKKNEFYPCPYYSEVIDWFADKGIYIDICIEDYKKVYLSWCVVMIGEKWEKYFNEHGKPTMATLDGTTDNFVECIDGAICAAITYLNI